MDHAAVTVEREAADKDTKLKHIERYAITPFGYFPPLFLGLLKHAKLQ